MPTIVISGAASGLGLAFLKAYATDPANLIFALDRAPIPNDEHLLNDNQPSAAQIVRGKVDVTDESSIAAAVSLLEGKPVDLLLHSAGIRGLVPKIEDANPSDVAACETLEVMDVDTLMRTFHINAVGTFLLLRTFLPHLKTAKDSKVVIMSSRMGSLGANVGGSAYAYRASKAALNAMVKSFSIDVPEVAFIMCHPGRVETKLVRSKEEGAISAEESVNGLRPLISKWDKQDSGKFFDRFGEPIKW